MSVLSNDVTWNDSVHLDETESVSAKYVIYCTEILGSPTRQDNMDYDNAQRAM